MIKGKLNNIEFEISDDREVITKDEGLKTYLEFIVEEVELDPSEGDPVLRTLSNFGSDFELIEFTEDENIIH